MKLYDRFLKRMEALPLFHIEICSFGDYITDSIYNNYDGNSVSLNDIKYILNEIEKKITDSGNDVQIDIDYDENLNTIDLMINEYGNGEVVYYERLSIIAY